MRIVIPHSRGQQEAIRRIDAGADQVLGASYSGIQLNNVQKQWEGSTLKLSLSVGAGFLSIPVSAQAEVEESQVVVEFEIPAIAKHFVSEEETRKSVEERVKALLETT